MRAGIRLICVFLMIGAACFSADLTPIINFSLDKTGKEWKELIHSSSPDQTTLAFVPEGENSQNWTEMFSYQYFHNVPETPVEFYHNFMNELKEHIKQYNVKSRLISQTGDSVLGEWSISEGGSVDQHEWVRIVKKGDDLLLLHYVSKDLSKVEKVRSFWENFLNQVTFNHLTFSTDDYRFTFPSDWVVVEAKFDGLTKRSFEDPKAGITLLEPEVVQFLDKNPKEFLKEASEDQNLWGEFDKYEPLKLNNGNLVELMIYKPRVKYRAYETTTILAPIVQNKKLYLIAATVPSASYKVSREKLDQVLKTFVPASGL